MRNSDNSTFNFNKNFKVELSSEPNFYFIGVSSVISCIAIGSNFVVLYTIYRFRILRTSTNYFIASLAFADFLLGVFLIPTVVVVQLGKVTSPDYCVLLNCAILQLTFASIISLLGVNLERYLAISDPFRHKRIVNMDSFRLVLVFIWLFSLILGLVPFPIHILQPQGGGGSNPARCSLHHGVDIRYLVYARGFGVIIPTMIIMIVVYVNIFRIIRKHLKRTAPQRRLTLLGKTQETTSTRTSIFTLEGLEKVFARKKSSIASVSSKRGPPTTISVALNCVLFCLFWVPLSICDGIILFAPENSRASPEVILAIMSLSFANSAIHPWIYAFGNSQIKTAILQTLHRQTPEFLTDFSYTSGARKSACASELQSQRDLIEMPETQSGPSFSANYYETSDLTPRILSDSKIEESADPTGTGASGTDAAGLDASGPDASGNDATGRVASSPDASLSDELTPLKTTWRSALRHMKHTKKTLQWSKSLDDAT